MGLGMSVLGAGASATSCCATMMASMVGSCACTGCAYLGSSIARASARVAYCCLFFLTMLLSWILRDYAKPMMEKIPWVARHAMHYDGHEKSYYFGEEAVLRLSMGSCIFFFGLAGALAGVENTADRRARHLHHGSWALKFFVWLVFSAAPFFFPEPVIHAYEWMARFGSGAFLLVQLVILVDFAHAWNDAWAAKEGSFWLGALIAVTGCCFSLALTLVGFMFHFFAPAGKGCGLNVFFIVVTLLLIVTFGAAAMHPAARDGSLMPSSIIALYCAYLCFSALNSEPATPDWQCNALRLRSSEWSKSSEHGAMAAGGFAFTLVSVLYSALRIGSTGGGAFSAGSDDDDDDNAAEEEEELEGAEDAPVAPAMGAEEAGEVALLPKARRGGGARARRGVGKPVPYNYAFFHAVFALASMYVAMLMTGWGARLDVVHEMSVGGEIDQGWASTWVKVGSQWLAAGLYLWSVAAPACFPDRDFS